MLVQDIERSERFSVISSVVHKVMRPDMVAILGPEPNTRTIVQSEPYLLWLFHWYFKRFTSPQTLDTFGVHPPACISQQGRNPAIPISTILARKFDYISHQAVFVSAANWQPPLC